MAALEQERSSESTSNTSLQVARRIQQASLPKEVPQLEGWQILPSTGLPERWEETSTTSTSSLKVE